MTNVVRKHSTKDHQRSLSIQLVRYKFCHDPVVNQSNVKMSQLYFVGRPITLVWKLLSPYRGFDLLDWYKKTIDWWDNPLHSPFFKKLLWDPHTEWKLNKSEIYVWHYKGLSIKIFSEVNSTLRVFGDAILDWII